MVPPVALAFISLLFGLSGASDALPVLTPFALVFICTTGALGVVWALARLWQPQPNLALVDAAGRTWVGGLLLYFVLAGVLPPVFLLFVVSEWLGAAHQGLILIPRAGA